MYIGIDVIQVEKCFLFLKWCWNGELVNVGFRCGMMLLLMYMFLCVFSVIVRLVVMVLRNVQNVLMVQWQCVWLFVVFFILFSVMVVMLVVWCNVGFCCQRLKYVFSVLQISFRFMFEISCLVDIWLKCLCVKC